MNQKDWLETFRENEGRDPTAEEFMAAKSQDFQIDETDPVRDLQKGVNEISSNADKENQVETKVWLEAFKQKYGRNPNPSEFIVAKESGFPAIDAQESSSVPLSLKPTNWEELDKAEKQKNTDRTEGNKNYWIPIVVAVAVVLLLIASIGIFVSQHQTSQPSQATATNSDTTTYTIDDILSEYPITFYGYVPFGTANYDTSVWQATYDNTDLYDSTDNAYNAMLVNGATITFTLKQSFIDQQSQDGKTLTGTQSTQKTVSALPDSISISNYNDFLAKLDQAVEQNMSLTSVNRVTSYFLGKGALTGTWHGNEFCIFAIYLINGKYYLFGYTGLSLNGSGTLDLSSLSSSKFYSNANSSYDSENNAYDALTYNTSEYIVPVSDS